MVEVMGPNVRTMKDLLPGSRDYGFLCPRCEAAAYKEGDLVVELDGTLFCPWCRQEVGILRPHIWREERCP